MTVPPTEYHKHVASKYNYAFGKDTPFLPSNATSYNGEFLSPKTFPRRSIAAIATRRATTSGASRRTPTASALPGISRT